MSIAVAVLLTGLVFGQELRPEAPSGWTAEKQASAWVLKPASLNSGEIFIATITPPEKRTMALDAFHESLWAGLGTPQQVVRNGKPAPFELGSWKGLQDSGTVTDRGVTLCVGIAVFEKGDLQFAHMNLANSPDLLAKYSPPVAGAVSKMLGVSPSASVGSGLEATFPAGWIREDRGPFRIAHFISNPDRRLDKYLYLLPPEPIKGGIETTFERIWNRETKQGGIKLHNPGLLSPVQPTPLARRLNSGLPVYWEGGEGVFNNLDCFVQVFVIPSGTFATPVLAIYGTGSGSTSDETRFPIYQFLEGLRPPEPPKSTDLFSMKDCVGSWRLDITVALAGFYSSSGAYLGDASTGGMEDLDLKADGNYTRFLVGKSSTANWSHRESGKWKVTDTTITLSPTKGQPVSHRIYGRVSLAGVDHLLLGNVDGTRIPTDALENGQQVEIVIRGGSLLRYYKR